jgi:hypothetical protein
MIYCYGEMGRLTSARLSTVVTGTQKLRLIVSKETNRPSTYKFENGARRRALFVEVEKDRNDNTGRRARVHVLIYTSDG